jgi:hypothetical protein
MAGARLRFGLLGPLLMTVAGTPVELGMRKQRAVLAMLLLGGLRLDRWIVRSADLDRLRVAGAARTL